MFHQEFHVTDANSSPNLLSRYVCFRMEVLQICFMVTGKEVQKKCKMEEISPSTKPHWKMEEVMHLIDPESVRNHHLLNRKYWMSMLMFSKDLELSQENPTSLN